VTPGVALGQRVQPTPTPLPVHRFARAEGCIPVATGITLVRVPAGQPLNANAVRKAALRQEEALDVLSAAVR
jgi:hypothetical protein